MSEFEIVNNQFAYNYIQMMNDLKELKNEKTELLSDRKEIPHFLADEIYRHITIIDILTQASVGVYNKIPREEKNLDDWDFDLGE